MLRETLQVKNMDRRLKVLLESLDLPVGHPLADLIDVAAVRVAASRFGDLDYLQRRAIHDAATAIRWANRTDLA